jgi:hypothetical protein
MVEAEKEAAEESAYLGVAYIHGNPRKSIMKFVIVEH